MSRKSYRLTPDLQQQIVAGIRAGAFGHVAAEAWGIPRRVFERWLRRGHGPKAPEPFAGFAADVRGALAQARLRAEMAAFEKDARVWLEHGPGREAPGNPGWTGTVKPPDADSAREANPLLQREFMSLCKLVLQVLVPFPEARAQVAGALVQWRKVKK